MTDHEEPLEFKFVTYKGRLSVVVEDSIYEINQALRDGAEDLLAGVSFRCNPHRYGSQRHEDWNYGHELAQDEELGHKLGGDVIDQLASTVIEEVW